MNHKQVTANRLIVGGAFLIPMIIVMILKEYVSDLYPEIGTFTVWFGNSFFIILGALMSYLTAFIMRDRINLL